MKKILVVLAFITISISSVFAQQKIAYVDSELVLKHIPEFNAAQKQLDNLSAQWQKEVDLGYAQIEKLYQAYQNDQSMLNENMRRRREDEIISKEKQVKELQKQKFGFEGELFQTRAKLMQPIQERVSKAIQEIAKAQSIDLVMDKGPESTFLFASPTIDKTNDVLTKLGLKYNPTLANQK